MFPKPLPFLLALALLPACDSAPAAPLPAPGLACACQAPQACPANVCDLQIEIAAKSCTGQVGDVELMLGNQLDPRTFRVGQPQRTCATIPRGTSLKLWARATRPADAGSSVLDWQWVEDITCPAQAPQDATGPTIARILECNEAPAQTTP